MCVRWFDKDGNKLGDDFRYRFKLVSKDWLDSFIDGAVPKDAVKAQFFVGFDVPNVPEGEYMAISEVSIVQKTEQHPYYKEGSFVSLPYQMVEMGQYFTWEADSSRETGIRFQIAMAQDNDNTPGEWSDFTDFKGFFKASAPQAWIRYKAIFKSDGKATPRLKSVAVGNRKDENWTYSIDKSPSLNMLSKSPNQDPASEIRF
jgi:hypothetical protein